MIIITNSDHEVSVNYEKNYKKLNKNYFERIAQSVIIIYKQPCSIW